MRNPVFHFDAMRKHFPEGWLLYELIREWHRSFSLQDLADGQCNKGLFEVEETARMANYLMLLYDRFGQNTYVIGPKVQELFRRTDLAKVTPDMLKEPQTGFYVALPECPLLVWGGPRTRWHRLDGVYVGFTRGVEALNVKNPSHRSVHFALWGAPNEKSLGRTDDALVWYSMNLDHWDASERDLESFFETQAVMLVDEEDVKEWAGHDPFDPGHVQSQAPTQEDVEEHRRTLMGVLRIVFNLCLYLASDQPDLDVRDSSAEADALRKKIAQKKPGGKRKKLERQLQNVPKTRTVYVGPLFEALEVKPVLQGARDLGGTHATPVEHAVRPHWQRYWVGSGDQREARWTLKGMYVRGTGVPERTIVKIKE